MRHHEDDTRDEQRESQRKETVAKRTDTLKEGAVCVCVCVCECVCTCVYASARITIIHALT